jgi:hypothetical protein
MQNLEDFMDTEADKRFETGQCKCLKKQELPQTNGCPEVRMIAVMTYFKVFELAGVFPNDGGDACVKDVLKRDGEEVVPCAL